MELRDYLNIAVILVAIALIVTVLLGLTGYLIDRSVERHERSGGR